MHYLKQTMVYSEGYMTCKTFFMLCSNNYKDFMKNCTPIKNLRCVGNIYLFKGNNMITRKRCEISSKLRKVLCFFVKACIQYFLSNFYFSPNDSPSKTEKCFLFHLKSSFRS